MILPRLKEKYGHKKLMITSSDGTGCGLFRSKYPYIFLKDSFTWCEFSTGFPARDPRSHEADIIWLQRPNHEYFLKYIPEKQNEGKKVIIDLDDTLHHIPAGNLAHKHYGKKELNAVDAVFNLANCLTTSTIPLQKDLMNRYNKKTYIIPNHLFYDEIFIDGDKPINEKIKIAWAGSYCYDEETEVLTEDGWKFFKDLNRSEKVASLNPITNKLEYYLPSEYVIEDYSGEMYYGKNRDIDFCVTPNHNMYVSPIKDISKKDLNYSFITMENLENTDFHVKQLGVSSHLFDKVIRAKNITKILYSGKIYCVTVPHHTLYVRRNGRSMWCGNTHCNDFDHHLVNVLRGLPRDKVDFYSMGFTPSFFKDFAISLPWVETDKFHQVFRDLNFDIGIMVASDNMFNKCKSNLKFLEYGATKTAAVGHSVYPYINTIEHGVDGFLVTKEKTDWKQYIYRLIEDVPFRLEMANKAHEKVKKLYTYEEDWEALEQTYIDIFDYLEV